MSEFAGYVRFGGMIYARVIAATGEPELVTRKQWETRVTMSAKASNVAAANDDLTILRRWPAE
jgi:hypothetical protein